MLWDVGQWQPDGRNDDEQIDFILTGTKLKGAWTLVRMRNWDVRGESEAVAVDQAHRPPAAHAAPR